MNKVLPCALLLALIASEVWAAEVTIFKSGDFAAYDLAIAGFKELISGVETSEENMKGDTQAGMKIIEGIKARNPKAILAVGTRAAELSHKEIKDIPIVYCMVIGPEKLGISGNNIAGVAMEVSSAKQISNFKSALPSLKNIGVVYDPENSSQRVEEGRKASQNLGMKLTEKTVSSPKEVPDAFRDLVGTVDAIWLLPDTTVLTKASFNFILNTTMEKKIPLLAFSDSLVKGGALLSFSTDYRDVGKLAGRLVKKILSGVAPNTLSLASPEGELTLNLHIADFLGIKFKEEIKRKAKVID